MKSSDAATIEPTPVCARIAPSLALLGTGVLSPREEAQVQEHASGCAWCRREIAAYDALDGVARQRFAGGGTSHITLEGILRAAETSAGEYPRGSWNGRGFPSGRPRLSAFGAIAAVLVVGIFTGLIVTMHLADSAVGSGPLPPPPVATTMATTTTVALIGPTWTLTGFVVDGIDQPIVAGSAPTLLFYADGLAGGNGGCNGYGASYTLSGGALTIGGVGFTQMYCQRGDGGTGLMQQENAYFQAVPRVEHYQLHGDTLILTSGDGRVQMVFRAS